MTPLVQPLHLAEVTRLPDWHPPVPGGGYPVLGFAVHHPDGIVLVDTGIGAGNPVIDEWYGPRVTPLADCVPLDRVVAVVNTHLHFDHCGQNDAVPDGVPIYVQRAEPGAEAQAMHLLDGDAEVLDGIEVLATPGHTPGHQSVLVGHTLIVGQAAWTRREWEGGVPVGDAFDESWHAVAQASLAGLKARRPEVVWFSHDPEPHCPS